MHSPSPRAVGSEAIKFQHASTPSGMNPSIDRPLRSLTVEEIQIAKKQAPSVYNAVIQYDSLYLNSLAKIESKELELRRCIEVGQEVLTQMQTLRRRCQTLETENGDLLSEVERLRKALSLHDQGQLLASQTTTQSESLLRTELQESIRQNSQLRAEVQRLHGELSLSTASAAATENRYTKALQMSHEKQQRSSTATEQDLLTANEEIGRLREAQAAFIVERDRLVQDLRQSQITLGSATDTIAQLRSIAERQQRAGAADEAADMSAMTGMCQSLRQALLSAGGVSTPVLAMSGPATSKQLRGEIDFISREVGYLLDRVRTGTENDSRLHNQLRATSRDMEALQSDRDELDNQLRRVRAESSVLRQELEHATTAIQFAEVTGRKSRSSSPAIPTPSSGQGELAALRTISTQLQTELTSLQARLDITLSQKASLETEIEGQRKRYAQLQEELASASGREMAAMEKSQNELVEWRRRAMSAESKVAAAQREASDANNALEAAVHQHTELLQATSALSSANASNASLLMADKNMRFLADGAASAMVATNSMAAELRAKEASLIEKDLRIRQLFEDGAMLRRALGSAISDWTDWRRSLDQQHHAGASGGSLMGLISATPFFSGGSPARADRSQSGQGVASMDITAPQRPAFSELDALAYKLKSDMNQVHSVGNLTPRGPSVGSEAANPYATLHRDLLSAMSILRTVVNSQELEDKEHAAAQLRHAATASSAASASLNANSERHQRELLNEVASLQRTNQSHEERHGKASAEIDRLRKALEKFRNEATSMEEALAIAADRDGVVVRNLQADKDRLQRQVDKLRAERDGEGEVARQKQVRLEAQVTQLEVANKALSQHNAQLHVDLKSSITMVADGKAAAMSAASTTAIEDLEARRLHLQGLVDGAYRDLKAVISELQGVEQHLQIASGGSWWSTTTTTTTVTTQSVVDTPTSKSGSRGRDGSSVTINLGSSPPAAKPFPPRSASNAQTTVASGPAMVAAAADRRLASLYQIIGGAASSVREIIGVVADRLNATPILPFPTVRSSSIAPQQVTPQQFIVLSSRIGSLKYVPSQLSQALSDEVALLTDMLTVRDEQHLRHSELIKDRQGEIGQLQRQVEAAECEHEQLLLTRRKLEAEIHEVRTALNDANSQLHEVAHVASEDAAAKARTQRRVDLLSEQLETQRKDFESELNSLKSKNDSLKKRLEEERSSKGHSEAETHDQINQLRSQGSKLMQQLSTANSLLIATKNDLEGTLHEKRMLDAQCSDKEEKLQRLTAMLVTARAEIDKVNSDLEGQKSQLTRDSLSSAKGKEEIALIMRQAQDRIRELQEELTATRAERNAKIDAVAALSQQVQELSATARQRSTKRKIILRPAGEAETSEEDGEGYIPTTKYFKLRAALMISRRSQEELARQLESERLRSASLQSEVQACLGRLRQMKDDYLALQTQSDAFAASSVALEKRLVAVEADRDPLRERLHDAILTEQHSFPNASMAGTPSSTSSRVRASQQRATNQSTAYSAIPTSYPLSAATAAAPLGGTASYSYRVSTTSVRSLSNGQADGGDLSSRRKASVPSYFNEY